MTLSITRLKLKSIRSIFQFLKLSGLSIEQAQHANGIIYGATVFEWPRVFWTITVWDSDRSMFQYIGKDAHLNSMRFLPKICEEAAVTHQTVESWDSEKISMGQIRELLQKQARFSTVLSPSSFQAQKIIPPLRFHRLNPFFKEKQK